MKNESLFSVLVFSQKRWRFFDLGKMLENEEKGRVATEPRDSKAKIRVTLQVFIRVAHFSMTILRINTALCHLFECARFFKI
jgi:hypothetical protein